MPKIPEDKFKDFDLTDKETVDLTRSLMASAGEAVAAVIAYAIVDPVSNRNELVSSFVAFGDEVCLFLHHSERR